MKVLIANPPAYIKDNSRHFVQSGSRWSFSMPISKEGGCKDHYLPYPFFLGYSSALLKRDSDTKVKAVDTCALDFDEREFKKYVKLYGPDLFVVEVPTISFPLTMDILKDIRSFLDCKIAVAGGQVTALTKEAMEQYKFIDYCLLGEYEITLKELVEKLARGKDRYDDLKHLRGIAFRHGNGIVINERRELLRDLDCLPFPDREDLPVNYYHDFEIVGLPTIQMWSSRGCPFNCIFCLERQVIYASPLYRKRNPSMVVNEMKLCRERYGAKQIYFDDETMTVDRRHVRAICEEMLMRRLDVPWACMGDITLDYETLKLMAKAGCVGIKFGVETISAETLKSIGKSFVNIKKVRQFVKWCKELGLWTHATYMIGLPKDTKGDIVATIKFATELDTDSAQFSIATPFPGTPFFETAKKNGWLTTLNWEKYDGANCAVISYSWLKKEEIEHLHKEAINTYSRHIIIRNLSNPRKFIEIVLSVARTKELRQAIRKAMVALRVIKLAAIQALER